MTLADELERLAVGVPQRLQNTYPGLAATEPNALETITKAAAALRAQEWMPIETAPGGEVLLYFPRIVTGAHRQSVLSEMYRVGRVSDTPNRRPTHWRPLPASPNGEPL